MHYAKCLMFTLFLIGGIILNANATSLVETKNIAPNPLKVGERLTYSVSAKRLPAGTWTNWIVKAETINEQNLYRIVSTVKTSGLFRLYSFRRQEETYFNPITLSPVSYQCRIKDRDYRSTVTTDFSVGKAEYEKISRAKPKLPQKREAKVLEIPPGTQDELSTLYFLRSKQLALGKTYSFPLLTIGKVQKATLTVERREVVKNKVLGTVRTLVLRTSNGDRFWITEDARRLPVKFQVQTKLGAVSATLKNIEMVN